MVASIPGTDALSVAPAALAMVPGLESGRQPLRVERLAGGSVNDVWRVDTPEGRFVLRIDGPAWRRPGVDRPQELLLHRAAAGGGLAPRIVAHSPAHGALVTEFIDARCWSDADYGDAAQLTRLGERLARLHQLPPPSEVAMPFAPLTIAQSYATTVRVDGERASYIQRLLAAVERAAAEISLRSAPLVVVHGDPTHGNVLDSRPVVLIDWEYAQLADPVFDVAAVLVYYPQSRAHRSRLLAAAGLREVSGDGRLGAAACIHAALAWLWRQARGEFPPLDAGISASEWAH